MYQALGMVVAFGVGMVLFGAAVRAVALRWGIAWREALTYFGVMPEQDEPFPARRAPARPRGR
jgi:hypothetical protein